jgi:peptide/nickel transport system substrate-binding protein
MMFRSVMQRGKRRSPNARRWPIPSVIVLAVLVAVSACSGSAGGAASGQGSGITLTVGGEMAGMTRVFNPFLPTSALGLAGNAISNGSAAGFIYEPLVQVDYVRSNYVIPWLASSWTWSNDNKTLTWHLRQGVKWSDGQPFSSADVVYTFQLMAKYPALNGTGVSFNSVSAPNSDTVVMTFATPQKQNFEGFAGQIIVPKHIWDKVSNPTTYADPNPVGTGPYLLSSFSPQGYLLVKNPHYWQPGKPQVAALRFVDFSDNETLANAVSAGQIDWAADYLPDAQSTYLDRSTDNHYWVPEAGSDGLIPNLDTFPLSDLAVRKAISVGVDRSAIAAARNSPPATNVSGLPVPSFDSIITPQYKNSDFPRQNVSEAKSILAADGWTMGPGGYYQKDGRQLTFSMMYPSEYTDIAASASVLVQELKAIGINMTLDPTPESEINNLDGLGRFDSTMGYPVGYVPTAWSFYSEQMDPQFYEPIGKSNPTFEDIERFNDPAATALFEEYPTASPARQAQIVQQWEGIWASQLPVITMIYWGDYGEWNSSQVTGWATPSDPYFEPSPNEVVALQLKPTTS